MISNKERLGYMVQRTPRIIPAIQISEISIEKNSNRSSKPSISWLNMLFPPIAMMMMTVITSILMKSKTMIYSVVGMTLITIIVSIVNYVSSIRKHKKQEAEKKAKYMEYMDMVVQKLQSANVNQKEVMSLIHPNTDICIEIVKNMDKSLWERTSIETDFLHTRVGIGTQALKLKVKFPQENKALDEEDLLLSELMKKCEPLTVVKDIPFVLPIRDIGILGLVGKRNRLSEVINSLILHLTTHHGYDEVKTIFIYSEEEKEQWEWLRWLPHVWSDDQQTRFMASDSTNVLKIVEEVQQQLKSRESRKNGFSENSNQNRLPHYVFFVLAPELLESLEFFNYLLSNQPSLGLTSVFLTERIDVNLPLNCQTIIEVSDRIGIIRRDQAQVLSDYNENIILDFVGKHKAEQFARQLAPIKLKETGGKNKIPSLVTFLELFQVERVEELGILNRWTKNQANRTMAVPLGKESGGKLFMFDMHEKFYGPHGLVAGTTGSGKSELLQALILALAVNYHPHEVSMVIVDYKGGGMANAFIGMPHLIGTITNLGGNEINRALVSIKSELKRRQVLFGEIGVNSIDAYIVNYRDGVAKEPLPHLFIIVDEFAELKSDQPEFMVELVSAARVGRSLGIHLILATQKPSGVVNDQIWSNSRFKLCLKVQDVSDSQEMLKRPEAAEIKEKGRGYLQVGNNEVFTLFQSAWSGAPYQVNEVIESDQTFYKIELNGNRTAIKRNQVVLLSEGKKISQLDAVVEQIKQVIKDSDIKAVKPLWLMPLPERLSLEDCYNIKNVMGEKTKRSASKEGLTFTVGIVDNPAAQIQFSLQMDLGKEGHILIYGVPNSGKTTLLKSIIIDLVTSYTADDLNLYLLDFGSRTLAVFHELPHLGDVLYLEEEDKLLKLFKMLTQELENRKRLFAAEGVGNIFAFRNLSSLPIPAIVIILDNFTAFSENYNDAVAFLIMLIREGGNYGIHLILTGTSGNTFSYKITQNVRQSITLQMADKNDYYALVGRTNGLEPANVPGRGLVKIEMPLEFHTALPYEGATDEEIALGIRKQCKQINQSWKGRRAKKVPTIPAKLSAEELIGRCNIDNIPENELTELFPVGLELEETLPVYFKLEEFFSCLFSYSDLAQANQMIHALVPIWRKSFETQEILIHVIEGIKSPLQLLKKTLEIDSYIIASDPLQEFIDRIIDEMQTRKDSIREASAKSQDPDTFDEYQFIQKHYSRQFICITDLQHASKLMNEDILKKMDKITMFGNGLGIYLFICSPANDINKLKNTLDFVSPLLERKCAIVTGGSLQQHTAFSQEMNGIPYSEQNRDMGEGIGWLFRKNQKVKIKLPI
ncbi:type VII secretion protein EssC [Paenibacillus psychroresistens]|uniref:Type VII secretion protein EssC n=1 Tax=Paenibacillus psychroresistens TaxID=1778678 RepID=A0A6B8RR13_9BACL|nr:type VII secretion protein EssC [Paenibacillus psychroresistens]QGQ98831.1 type VII secretion protein EssC [Paenibacillus psychroresistens]